VTGDGQRSANVSPAAGEVISSSASVSFI
jgi:hypothetical protein